MRPLLRTPAYTLSGDPELTPAAPRRRCGTDSPALNSGMPAPQLLPATDTARRSLIGPSALAAAIALASAGGGACAASGAGWALWASGLQPGVHPRLAVAPDHTIYYAVLATAGTRGLVYKAADARAPAGVFAPLPPIPYVTIGNNIQALTTTAASEPVAGIFHSAGSADPVAFVLDKASGQWIAAALSTPPSLGVFSMVRAPNGDIWFGAKWAYVYRSTAAGRSYVAIDESAKVKAAAPCYYPTFNNATSDGAIYSINVDRRGWVHAGTETAGVIYSDDAGATWRPLDAQACLASDPTQRNPASPMAAATRAGNVGAVGFTRDNRPVWNGTELFQFGWDSSIGVADPDAQAISPAIGFPVNFIYRGLQISRIVTTTAGTLFLHSGANPAFDPSPPPPPGQSQYSMGLYRSDDGIHWAQFNTGIASVNDGLSEGGLAVDGNRVFTATSDGKVWYFDADDRVFSDGFDG